MVELNEKYKKELIVKAVCQEPEGKIERSVYTMPLTIDNLKTLWDKSRNLQTIFSRETRGEFHKFVDLLMHGSGSSLLPNGLFWVVDDFIGVFYMTRIVPGTDAVVHYIFFDKRHKGRETLVKAMIKWTFLTFEFRRITVELPDYVTDNTKFFVEKHLGFKKEGRRRKAVEYKGMWFDLSLYGMLKEEAFVNESDSPKWVAPIEKSEAVQPLE